MPNLTVEDINSARDPFEVGTNWGDIPIWRIEGDGWSIDSAVHDAAEARTAALNAFAAPAPQP